MMQETHCPWAKQRETMCPAFGGAALGVVVAVVLFVKLRRVP